MIEPPSERNIYSLCFFVYQSSLTFCENGLLKCFDMVKVRIFLNVVKIKLP